jgi:mono/diheme cytochrome c family protein
MRRRPKLISPLLALVALAATVIVASGCGTTTADVDRGRVLFKEKCGTCHILAQAGTVGIQGPDLDDAFAAARESGQNGDTIEGVVKAQVELPRPDNGNPAVSMPADIVTGQDLEDVAAYLGMWAGVPGAAPPKVPGGPGAQVFANQGCGSCHILEAAGSGGATGPDLDEVLTAGTTPEEIHEDIVDPEKVIASGYPAGVMPANFEELLTPKELDDLVQYLFENTPAGKGKSGKSSG